MLFGNKLNSHNSPEYVKGSIIHGQIPQFCQRPDNFIKITFLHLFIFRYAAILFKKQRYVSATHRLSTKIVCKDNFKYEVQERQPSANAILDARQLAEEYWRIDKFFLISFPILFFIFNIIYWLAFILWRATHTTVRLGCHKEPMLREIDSTTAETILS